MDTALPSLELDSLSDRLDRNSPHNGTQDERLSELETRTTDQSLGRVDGGASAWRVLCAAFVLEAILWGFPLSFGVFQEYYSGIPQFANSPFITYVGSIATGITYFGAPIMAPLVKRYANYQIHMVWAGWVLCLAGLIGGSFVDTVGSLVATQGVIYGVGYLIIFYPVVSLVNEWWVARRGLAWGIMLGSSGASGVAYPFVNEALLNRYGYKTTLRALAVATCIMTAPLLPLLKRRLPTSRSSAPAPTNWSFFKEPLFWFYFLSTVAYSLGFYLPSLYLPSYASSLGFNPRIGAMLLALMSMAQVGGQFTFGYLSDGGLSLNILLLSSSVVGAVVSWTAWGLARSLAPLVIFALSYGFFAYAFMAMRVRMGTAVTADPSAALPTFCVFSFAQGTGNVLAGPISAALLRPVVDLNDYGCARYKEMIIFTGCSMAVSALCIGASYLGRSKTRT